MDKLLYEAKALLISIRMGADKETINNIDNYNSRLNSQDVKFEENINYTNQDLSDYNLKLASASQDLKNSMDYLMDDYNVYSLTNFLAKLHDYRKLKAEKEKKERIAKETEGVIDMFGDFSETKQVNKGKKSVTEYKTTDELTKERNTRLAMLNQMHVEGKITDEELKRNVIYLRRVYGRAIERQAEKELLEEVKENKDKKVTKQIKNKFSNIISKIANIFKINIKEKAKIETTEKEQDELIDRNARQALGKAADIIVKTENTSKPEVLSEINELTNVNIELYKNHEKGVSLFEIASEIYNVNIMNAKDEEMQQYISNRILNFGDTLISKPNGEIEPNNDLEKEKEKFIDYMHSKYPIKFEMLGGIAVEKFEDDKIQKMYDSILKQFDDNILKVKNLNKCKDVVKDMVSDLQTGMNI